MLVLAYLVVALVPAFAQNYKQIELKQGPVVGFRTVEPDVFSFYGIPYAKTPLGKDKFKGPLEAPTWTEPLYATNDKIMCPQYDPDDFFPGHEIHEDCLVLNVFIPNTEEKNLPVLAYIHGGGFFVGHGNWEKPTEFVGSKKVIVVTFNYRLGPHGFLCMGTEYIPGNAGIKDQVAALRWIKENIASFGGDPEEITIAGCSAGGASVDLHIVSKMSNGLFKKVIGQSGANVAPFAIQSDPIENAKYYAEKIQFPGGDLKALEEFYKNVSIDQLMSHTLFSTTDHDVKMSPCIERDLGLETFLEKSPKDILKSGDYVKYPIIYGYTDMEGLLRIGVFEEWRYAMNEDFSQFIPANLKFESEEEKQNMALKIKQFYFGNESVSNETVLEYVDFLSDVLFVYPVQQTVSLQVEAGNDKVYLHVYTFTDENTPYVPYTNEKGADHCTHNLAVFDPAPNLNYTLTPEYLQIKKDLQTIWYNFMTTGNPTPPGSSLPTWQPTGVDRSPCMNFGRSIRLEGTFEKERTLFWDQIYNKHYRDPVAPSSSSISAPLNSLFVLFVFAILP